MVVVLTNTGCVFLSRERIQKSKVAEAVYFFAFRFVTFFGFDFLLLDADDFLDLVRFFDAFLAVFLEVFLFFEEDFFFLAAAAFLILEAAFFFLSEAFLEAALFIESRFLISNRNR